ncbi:MAG: hypothetical protein ACXAEN_18830, partial [Candidatus Thorarchaeota archaeon]
LVILDEPTSNLDVVGRDDVINLIVDLYNEMEVSFFISSHVLSELERACHNVAFIKYGKVVERGSVRDIINKHTSTRFRVVTSDSKRLLEVASESPNVTNATITGANSISVTIEEGNTDSFRKEIAGIAERIGVAIYAIEQASTLEEAFKEIMR